MIDQKTTILEKLNKELVLKCATYTQKINSLYAMLQMTSTCLKAMMIDPKNAKDTCQQHLLITKLNKILKEQTPNNLQMKLWNQFQDFKFEELKEKLKKIKNQIQKEGDELSKYLHKIMSKISLKKQKEQPPKQLQTKFLQTQSSFDTLLKQSNILKERQDLQFLIKCFPSQVAKIQIKFIASKNGYKMQKFYSSCCKLKNLIIVAKTPKNKVLGGFTPLSFNPTSQNYNENIKDPSHLSFVFSLSEKSKFQLNENKDAITRFKQRDSIQFSNTFGIFDNSNKSWNNYFYLCNHQYNTSKYANNVQSYLKLTGEQQTHNFLIVQWQAYQVTFK